MTEPWYATREDVKGALDYKETARNNAQVDRALAAVSRAIENNCHRVFYPSIATRYFDWPNYQYSYAWKLYLDQNDLISVTSLTSGGVTIQPSGYLLEPVNSGPPYTRVDINLASSGSSFNAGAGTWQRSIAITGLWGYGNTEAPAGAVAAAFNASVTTVQVTDSSSIGVGQVLRIGAERLLVTDKGQLSTGQTLQTPLTAQQANNIMAVTTGSAYTIGEVLLLDAERMRVEDIAGNNLTVHRAWDGSTLAAHTGSTIYAPRSLTVVRGALGTTAASALQGDPIVKWTPPSLIRQLTIGEAINNLQQEATGYARTVGNAAGSGNTKRGTSIEGLIDLRDLTYSTYTRKARKRAV